MGTSSSLKVNRTWGHAPILGHKCAVASNVVREQLFTR